MMVVYEIHTYRDGAWKIDSIFDDRDLSVLEAHRMERSLRYAGVRVIEETYDEATDKTVTRTIYRSSKAEKSNAAVIQRRTDELVMANNPRPPRASTAAKPPSVTRLLLVATLTAGAILFCSLGAIYALNALTR